MNNDGLDRIPVSQMPDRYGIARSAFYTRMNALGIEPKKVGNKAFLEGPAIQLMDDLDRHLKAGGTTAEFLEMRGIQPSELSSDEPSLDETTGLSFPPGNIIQIAAAIAAEMAARFQPAPPKPDPLAYFETLERAVRGGWVLKTSEVAYLLDLSASEIQQYGNRFSDAGFVFTQAGYRGGEVAWRVSKPV
ncbi:MAG: hypothetical protein VKK04_00875 [Synechococcales bacterium]|nr:hypothetical protein [Synechococcales bacterium]